MNEVNNDPLAGLSDDEIEEQLGVAVTHGDPAPPSLHTFALAAQFWGAEQHLLDGGQVEREPALAGMRGSDIDAVGYQYRDDECELYVTVERTLGGTVVTGAVIPPVPFLKRLAQNGTESDVDCDEFGRFEFTFDGRFALTFHTPEGRPVRTDLLG